MKSFALISAVAFVAGASAQYSASNSSSAAASIPAVSATTTITAKPGCPTGPAADVIVTRSDAPVPSCEAGSNSTKPSISYMPGYSGGMGGASGSGNATMTGTGMPSQFTGAAGTTAVSGALAAIAGFAVWLL